MGEIEARDRERGCVTDPHLWTAVRGVPDLEGGGHPGQPGAEQQVLPGHLQDHLLPLGTAIQRLYSREQSSDIESPQKQEEVIDVFSFDEVHQPVLQCVVFDVPHSDPDVGLPDVGVDEDVLDVTLHT